MPRFFIGQRVRVIDGRGTISNMTGTILYSLQYASTVRLDNGELLALINDELEAIYATQEPRDSEGAVQVRTTDGSGAP